MRAQPSEAAQTDAQAAVQLPQRHRPTPFSPPYTPPRLNPNPLQPPTQPSNRTQRRTWLYRIRPSVTHEPFHPLNFPAETLTADFASGVVTPNQLRWRPFSIPSESVDFVRGMFTVCGAGRCV